MDKRKALIWIIVFMTVITTPYISDFLFGQYMVSAANENRTLAEKPELTFESYEEFASDYEAYFNDHIPFRDQLVGMNGTIDYYLFGQSSNKEVLVGENGWLFYCSNADGNPVRQALGYGLYSEEEMEEIAGRLTLCKKGLEFLGMEFVVFVAPNKETIYIDQIPSYYERKNGITNAEQLVMYLRENTDLRVLYPKEELWQARAEYPSLLLYHKLDTHWNSMGGYIGAVSLAGELGVSMPGLSEITYEPQYGDTGDLTGMLNIRIKNGNVDYVLGGYTTLYTENIVNDDSGFVFHTPDADPRNLFVYRDSFAVALAPYLATQFENSYFVNKSYYDQQLLFDYNADIFVFETVERHIDSLRDFTVSFVTADVVSADGKKEIRLGKAVPDAALQYVSIYRTDSHTGKTETIQELKPFTGDRYLSLGGGETGEIAVYVYADEKGEELVGRNIAAY